MSGDRRALGMKEGDGNQARQTFPTAVCACEAASTIWPVRGLLAPILTYWSSNRGVLRVIMSGDRRALGKKDVVIRRNECLERHHLCAGEVSVCGKKENFEPLRISF